MNSQPPIPESEILRMQESVEAHNQHSGAENFLRAEALEIGLSRACAALTNGDLQRAAIVFQRIYDASAMECGAVFEQLCERIDAINKLNSCLSPSIQQSPEVAQEQQACRERIADLYLKDSKGQDLYLCSQVQRISQYSFTFSVRGRVDDKTYRVTSTFSEIEDLVGGDRDGNH